MGALIVFDFDDTLAMTIALMTNTFFTTLRRELIADGTLGLDDLTEEDFRNLCKEMNEGFGHTIHGFGYQLGKSRVWSNNLIRLVNHTIYEEVGSQIVIEHAIKQKLRELKRSGHTLVILTHSHAEAFSNLVMADNDLQDVFPPENVYDIIFLDGRTKLHEDAYENFLNRFAHRTFSRRIMVEDSPENLKAAKRWDFETILLGAKIHGNEDSYVDHRLPDISATLDHLLTTLP